MLERTTILIPTFNRTSGLKRLLHFLAAEGAACPILVLDSGDAASQEENAETCRTSPLSTAHHCYPEGIYQLDKWEEGLRLVGTEFSAFAADDDFVFPATLGECERFLLAHPDYVVCQGFFLSFRRQGREESSSRTHFQLDSPGAGREEETPVARVWMAFHSYAHLIYGLRRTACWVDSLHRINAATKVHRGHGSSIEEMLDAMLCLVAGKLRRLPLLHSLRNGKPTDAWPLSFLYGPDFSPVMTAFTHAFLDAFVPVSGQSRGECEALFLAAFHNYRQRLFGHDAPVPDSWKGLVGPFGKPEEDARLQPLLASLNVTGPAFDRARGLLEQFPLPIDFTGS